ncbi:Alpha-(1,3)-fucosyltransferase C [Armadillidium nasatum]|uniref:Fucosyltransferase n=1 Tax=Armadillidium nasatum TaxID=96803 RepID=A0A5N5SMZ0_9CRUS|nr:Alpha-(1,3)-fucosyltransferase C [Armadillidium nasatum]
MTYRRDSDIFAGYGYVIRKSKFFSPKSRPYNNFDMNLEKKMRSNTKMVAWIVSDCDTPSLRELIVEELKNYVDIFGYCGTLECKRSTQIKCFKMLEKNYKFYLSFENSLCKDYVSEKFFQIIKWNIIPVVYGSANYASLAPPHSYINARDFKNVEGKFPDQINGLDNNSFKFLQLVSKTSR